MHWQSYGEMHTCVHVGAYFQFNSLHTETDTFEKRERKDENSKIHGHGLLHLAVDAEYIYVSTIHAKPPCTQKGPTATFWKRNLTLQEEHHNNKQHQPPLTPN